jgi:hypothetical protein
VCVLPVFQGNWNNVLKVVVMQGNWKDGLKAGACAC